LDQPQKGDVKRRSAIQAQNPQAAFLIWTQYAAAGAAVQRGTREVQHPGVSVGRVARTDQGHMRCTSGSLSMN